MRTWRRVVIAVMVVATALLFYRWWRAASARAGRPPHETPENDEPEPAAARSPHPPGAPPREQGGGSGNGETGPTLDRAKADRMREEIRALLADAGLWAAGGEPFDAGGPVTRPLFGSMPVLGRDDAGNARVDPKYIQARVREDLFPLARGCYGDALKRDPKLAGKLVVYFRVIGDKKVGGVVDETKILGDTTIADAEMQTCVRESMMSVSFDAPPDDGELTVVYPILFSPEDDEAGAGP
jgi:hypothetical protein